MNEYRKKPIIVEAFRFLGVSDYSWASVRGVRLPIEERVLQFFNKVHDTELEAKYGDWVIDAGNGDRYPCDPETFERVYEPATRIKVIRDAGVGQERDRTIQIVRDKCEAAAGAYPIQQLARVKIHTNVEVCALLDEIDQLKRIVQAAIDCEDERTISGSNRVSGTMWSRVVSLLKENGYRLTEPQARPGRSLPGIQHFNGA
jgi:hypothetical protein